VSGQLILLRHSTSVWNRSGRFTGWSDLPLGERDLEQAFAMGDRLAHRHIAFDAVHHSRLQRTRQTAEVLLAGANHRPIPFHATWRLNERHYGQLQGMDKQEIFGKWGEEKYRRWWRGYFEPPPPLDWEDSRHPRFDPLYADLDPALLPASESLHDCQKRLLPYWSETIAPALTAGNSLLVVSHGNTLRGLIMLLDRLDPAAIEKVEVPSGVPLRYRFDAQLSVVGKEWLG